jgi:hypothetical protein
VLSSVVSETTVRITNEPRLPSGSTLWIDGAPLKGPIHEPLVYEIEAGDEGEMGAYIRTAAPLMSRDLVDTIQSCGVDNLEVYKAVLREKATGREYRNYVAVNVLGVVSGADPTQSVSTSIEGLGTWFDRLVVDENVTRGWLVFRLRGSLSKVIVHHRIKEAIEAKTFPLLQFISTDDFSG